MIDPELAVSVPPLLEHVVAEDPCTARMARQKRGNHHHFIFVLQKNPLSNGGIGGIAVI